MSWGHLKSMHGSIPLGPSWFPVLQFKPSIGGVMAMGLILYLEGFFLT
jgi:hypothetical protein